MKNAWVIGALILGLSLPPVQAAAQCMSGMMGGHGSHETKATPRVGKKLPSSVRKLMADEEGRQLLIEALIADPALMRMLIARIAEVPEWRALAADRLGAPRTPPGPADAGEADPGVAPDRAAYRCPMHSEVVSDRPGECPKCGMALARKQ